MSRNIDPLDSAVLTLGTIHSGTKYNVIADYAKIEGTVRTLNEEVQKKMEVKILEVVEGVCLSTGAKGIVKYQRGYPVLYSNPYMVSILKEVGGNILGQGKVIHVEKPAMGGEDFANYLQQIPGAFFWLGAGSENIYPIHHPQFDFDEEIMKIGMEMMTHASLHYLRKGLENEQ